MIMTTLQTPPEQTPKRKNWLLRHPVWTFVFVLAVAFVVLAGTAEPAPEPAAESVVRDEPDTDPVSEPDTDVDDGPAAEPAPEPEPEPDYDQTMQAMDALSDDEREALWVGVEAFGINEVVDHVMSEDDGTMDRGAVRDWLEANQPEPEPDETVAQQQAIISAESYLQMGGFSRSGLVDQLEYEGYDTADIEYAVDAVDANWRDQAVMSAENYMEMGGFSRASLIEQLEYEGFSTQHATNAADEVGL